MFNVKTVSELRCISEGRKFINLHVLREQESVRLTGFKEIGIHYRKMNTFAQVYTENASAAMSCRDSILAFMIRLKPILLVKLFLRQNGAVVCF